MPEQRDEARKGIAGGIDPLELKKEHKAEREGRSKTPFSKLRSNGTAWKWKMVSGYASDILEAFKKIFFLFGQRPVADIKPLEPFNVLKKSKPEVQQRKQRKCANDVVKCFYHAIVTGRAEYNPALIHQYMQGMNLNITRSRPPKSFLAF